MLPSLKYVISASRRTDIPAFYMEWFFKSIQGRLFELINPFNQKRRTIHAGPDHVGAIVFWSKNFTPFIKGEYGIKLKNMGYHLLFNFTINASDPWLEPNLPALGERLEQLKILGDCFPKRSIQWRFDPICFYRDQKGILKDNLKDFRRIAKRVADSGISQCTTSFVDIYPKVRKRVEKRCPIVFEDPGMDKKIETLLYMEDVLKPLGIKLSTCCEKKVMTELKGRTSILSGACISHNRVIDIYGGSLSKKRDRGQRSALGCLCQESFDVGNYTLHPCYHNCLFCYANPKPFKG